MHAVIRLQMIVVLLGGALSLAAQSPPVDMPSNDVVVRGALPHCKPMPNDPQDALALPQDGPQSVPAGYNVSIIPDGKSGGFRVVPNGIDTTDAKGHVTRTINPETALGIWLRSAEGHGFANFTFRVPADGTPLCIGAKSDRPEGHGRLETIFPGKNYACRFLRFSLFVASRKAKGLIWLNGGNVTPSLGADHIFFTQTDIPDRMAWTPVMLQVGPIDPDPKAVHFGIDLVHGDVWFVQPKFEIIPDAELSPRHRRDMEVCLSPNLPKRRFHQEPEDAKL